LNRPRTGPSLCNYIAGFQCGTLCNLKHLVQIDIGIDDIRGPWGWP
jgi:hypothetical protein